jgi:hypothetical protein
MMKCPYFMGEREGRRLRAGGERRQSNRAENVISILLPSAAPQRDGWSAVEILDT